MAVHYSTIGMNITHLSNPLLQIFITAEKEWISKYAVAFYFSLLQPLDEHFITKS